MARSRVSSTRFLCLVKVAKTNINLDSDLDGVTGDVTGDVIDDIVETDIMLN